MKISELFENHSSLYETLEVKNGKIIYYQEKTKLTPEKGLISTFNFKRNDTQFHKKTGGDVRNKDVYALYAYKPDTQSTEILSSLKGHGPHQIDPSVYEKFMSDTVAYAIHFITSEIIHRDDKNRMIGKSLPGYQYIVYPVSTSPFLKEFISRLESELPHIIFIKDAIAKKQLENIEEFANEMIDPEYYGYAKLTDEKKMELVKQIINNVKKNENEGRGSIVTLKNLTNKRDSHYISKFMHIVNDDILEIEGNNVLILDDILSSGTSFSEMIRVVSEFAPSSIEGLTIFKGTSSNENKRITKRK